MGNDEYEKLLEIASFLGKRSDAKKINQIKNFINQKKMFLTFWGHFSAGKSKLINTILGFPLLPVKTKETTAYLTYIQYGEIECCRIIYENGTMDELPIEKTKDYFQIHDTDLCKNNDSRGISHIEVFVNSELLRNGLCMVDTPGINTILQEHQVLAANAIEEAGKIFYILGASPSAIDFEFIKKIDECAIDIVFIRTKCDLLNPEEESYEEALAKEKKDIEHFLGKEIIFITVSSESDSLWTMNVNELRNSLTEISDDIAVNITKAAKKRILSIICNYQNELSNVLTQLKDIQKGSNNETENKIKEIENDIAWLKTKVNENTSSFDEKVHEAKRKLNLFIGNEIESSLDDFNSSLKKLDISELQTQAELIYNDKIESFVSSIQNGINSELDRIIQLEGKIPLMSSDFKNEVRYPTFQEIRVENSSTLDMLKKELENVHAELSSIINQYKNISNQTEEMDANFNEEEYEKALKTLEQEMDAIPTSLALRESDIQSVQPSEIFRRIGTVADIALFFIPSQAISSGIKAFANTTKIAQGLHKSSKIGKAIGQAIVNNTKVIDTIHDASYAVNTILKTRAYSSKSEKNAATELVQYTADNIENTINEAKQKQKSGNVLEMLSISYWMEKFGSMFDKPPVMETDFEELERRNELRKKISFEQTRLSQEKIARKTELGIIKTQQEKLRVQQDELAKLEKNIDFEVHKQEEILEKKGMLKRNDLYITEYCALYKKQTEQISKKILSEYFSLADREIKFYLLSLNHDLQAELETKKISLQNLLDNRENKTVKQQIEDCTKYITFINKVLQCD